MDLSQYRSVVDLPAIKDSVKLPVKVFMDLRDIPYLYIYEDNAFGRRLLFDTDEIGIRCKEVDLGETTSEEFLDNEISQVLEDEHAYAVVKIPYSLGSYALIWRRGDEEALGNILDYLHGCGIESEVTDAVNGPSCTKDWLMLRVIEKDNSYKPYVYGFDRFSAAIRGSWGSVRGLKKLKNLPWAEVVLD